MREYLNSLNERLVIILMWALLALLWVFEAVNGLAFFLIGGIISFFMLQFEYRVRLLALRYGRRKAKAKKSKLKLGVMSVRAQALNNLPTPILMRQWTRLGWQKRSMPQESLRESSKD